MMPTGPHPVGFKTRETYGTSDEFGAEWARPGKDNMGELR